MGVDVNIKEIYIWLAWNYDVGDESTVWHGELTHRFSVDTAVYIFKFIAVISYILLFLRLAFCF